MRWNCCCFAALFSLFVVIPAIAQENRDWPERAYITFDVPFQLATNDVSETLAFADTVRRTENVNFVMRYPTSRGALIDVSGGVRLRSNLGVGVTASWMQRSGAGSFELALPNPLVANSPLQLAGPITGLTLREFGIHVHALYARAVGSNVRVSFSAGPSVFLTAQDLVRSVDVAILPGFRSLRFDDALVSEENQTSVGFNVGANIIWAFTSRLGVETVTRYSRANVMWRPPSSSGVDRAIEARAGGLHVGGGIRVFF